jgi:phage shock protein E
MTASAESFLPLIPKLLSPEEAWEIVANGGILIDVRTPEEWAEGFFAEAILLDAREFPSRFEELLIHKNETLVLFCKSGVRSEKVGSFLLSKGFPLVVNGGGFSELSAFKENNSF